MVWPEKQEVPRPSASLTYALPLLQLKSSVAALWTHEAQSRAWHGERTALQPHSLTPPIMPTNCLPFNQSSEPSAGFPYSSGARMDFPKAQELAEINVHCWSDIIWRPAVTSRLGCGWGGGGGGWGSYGVCSNRRCCVLPTGGLCVWCVCERVLLELLFIFRTIDVINNAAQREKWPLCQRPNYSVVI